MSTQQIRYFVTDGGPLPDAAKQCDLSYFHEALLCGPGALRVVLPDGTIDLIAASRYVVDDAPMRLEVDNGRLQVVCMGLVIHEYAEWADYTDPLPKAEYPKYPPR